MKEHSYFSNLSDDDLVEFTADQFIKIGKLRKALKQILSGEIENLMKTSLKTQGIKTYPAAQISYPNGEIKVHQNRWFAHGMACRILKLGNKSWKNGKIKIRVEVEFVSDQDMSKATDFDEILEVEVNEITDLDDIDELVNLRRQLMDL